MAMAVGPAEGDDDVISAINTTPLVDVMLVLLIIFLITIPVVTTSIPRHAAQGARRDSRNQARKRHHLGGQGRQHLLVRSQDAQRRRPGRQAQGGVADEAAARVQIRGDLEARYEGVGKILLACQRAGIVKVAFITEPPPLGG
jgi:biopolymer transport protein ExbD